MKIVDLEFVPVDDGAGGHLLVFVDTDTELTGVGEAAMKGWTPVVAATVEQLRQILVGEDPRRIEHLWQLMWRSAFFPASGPAASAIAAIDIALWDLSGKRLGVPVFELLGGSVRDHVDCYAHAQRPGDDQYGADEQVQRLVDRCQDLVNSGWTYVRWMLPSMNATMMPRPSVRLAVTQMRAVRDAVGDEVELILDVHTRLEPGEAVQLCDELRPYRPYFVEDPIRSENLNVYQILRSRTPVRLAAGEQLASKWEFLPLVENDLIDVARLDVGITGMTEARKIAGSCEAHYINIVPHNIMGPVGTAATLHLSLATSGVELMELALAPDTLPDVYTSAPEFATARFVPPSEPGLGVTVDRAAARARRRTKPHRTPQLRRSDASYTNW